MSAWGSELSGTQDRSASDNPARNASGSSIPRGRSLPWLPPVPAPPQARVLGAARGCRGRRGRSRSGAAMVSGVGVDIGIAVGSDVGLGTGVAAGAGVFVVPGVGAELEQANSAATVTRTAQCSSFDMLNPLHLKILSSIVIQPASCDASQTYREKAISRVGFPGFTALDRQVWTFGVTVEAAFAPKVAFEPDF